MGRPRKNWPDPDRIYHPTPDERNRRDNKIIVGLNDIEDRIARQMAHDDARPLSAWVRGLIIAECERRGGYKAVCEK